MRWWGWGDDDAGHSLPEAADGLLRSELGLHAGAVPPRVELEEVRLPEPGLPAHVHERLGSLLGAEQLRDDREARVAHAAGRSYPDLVRLRAGDAAGAPDAVALPGTAAQVAALLAACSEANVAVVPFGGGTSVVGGVDAHAEGFAGSLSLDLRRLDRLLHVDAVSLTATVD